MMKASTYPSRIQLSFDEKLAMAERIKKSEPDKADEYLINLMHEWNSHNPHRPINLHHLRRIRDSSPEISNQDEFWESVKSEVETMLLQVTCEDLKVGSKKDKKGAAGPFAAKEVVCRGCPQSKPRTEHYCKGCLLLE